MKEAVAFLVFNRPECTERTFAEIRRARPQRLFVVADGPRLSRTGEAEKCKAVREIIDNGVDWPCDVERNYSNKNLGCASRLATGLTWAFSRAESLIVLEDDCLPDPSFFVYCEELLSKYRHDARVGQICGTPFIKSKVDTEFSYLYSRYGPIWGWASWRRAWSYYDLELRSWPQLKRSGNLGSIINSQRERVVRSALYDKLHAGNPSTWDFQWGYAKLFNSMLSVIPRVSLIENIGFGQEATHTATTSQVLGRFEMEFPLHHPDRVIPDMLFETAFSNHCAPSSLTKVKLRAASALKRVRRCFNP